MILSQHTSNLMGRAPAYANANTQAHHTRPFRAITGKIFAQQSYKRCSNPSQAHAGGPSRNLFAGLRLQPPFTHCPPRLFLTTVFQGHYKFLLVTMVQHTLRQHVNPGLRVVQGFCSPTSYTVANSAKQRIEPGIQPRQRRRLAQVAQHAVRAAKAREDHRVDALPWKGAVAHAVQPLARPRAQDSAKQLGFLQVLPHAVQPWRTPAPKSRRCCYICRSSSSYGP